MSVLSRFTELAKQRSLAVVLPEGQDERVIAAARRMKDEGIAEAILLGDPAQIESEAARIGIGLNGIELINPKESTRLEE